MLLLVGSAWDDAHDEFYAGLLAHAMVLIAIDAGADLCRRFNRIPDVAVGDWDSVSDDTLAWLEHEGATLVRLPIRKDVTDLEAALDVVADSFPGTSPVLTGVLGRRLDHTLASLGALASRAAMRPTVSEPAERVWVLSERGRRDIELGGPGSTFSVLSPSGDAVVTIAGARYPLASAPLPSLAPLGVSNVVVGPFATVRVEHGTALVITSADADIIRAAEHGSS